MRIFHKLKSMMLVAASLFCVGSALAETKIIYSWESPDGTVVETGGKATHENSDGKRANYANAGYYTLCLNGKSGNIGDAEPSNNAGYIQLALDEALEAGDKITITGYRNKNDNGKTASIYFLYENGTIIKDTNTWTNICTEDDTDWDSDGETPSTHVFEVPEAAAGSKILKMTRNSASTNLFLTKVVITREVVEATGPSITASTFEYITGAGIDPDTIVANLTVANIAENDTVLISGGLEGTVAVSGLKYLAWGSEMPAEVYLDEPVMAVNGANTVKIYVNKINRMMGMAPLAACTPTVGLALYTQGEWGVGDIIGEPVTQQLTLEAFKTGITAPEAVSVAVGETIDLNLVTEPADLLQYVACYPAQSGFVEYDNGKLTGLKEGTVLVEFDFLGVLDTTMVTVTGPLPAITASTFEYIEGAGLDPDTIIGKLTIENIGENDTVLIGGGLEGTVAVSDLKYNAWGSTVPAEVYLEETPMAVNGENIVKMTVNKVNRMMGMAPLAACTPTAALALYTQGEWGLGEMIGKAVSQQFNVEAFQTSLSAASSTVVVLVGQTVDLGLVTEPEGNVNMVSCYTEADSLIQYNYDGTVTGLKEGTAKLEFDFLGSTYTMTAMVVNLTSPTILETEFAYERTEGIDPDILTATVTVSGIQEGDTLLIAGGLEGTVAVSGLKYLAWGSEMPAEVYLDETPIAVNGKNIIEIPINKINRMMGMAPLAASTVTAGIALFEQGEWGIGDIVGSAYTTEFEVEAFKTSLTAAVSDTTMLVGETLDLGFVTEPEGYISMIGCYNEYENIVTYNMDGTITAVAEGTAKLEFDFLGATYTVNVTVEKPANNMAVVKNWDFASIADTLTADLYMTYSDETVKIGGTASNLGTGMFEGLAMQGANKFYLRNKSGGLYSGNGGGRKVGVLDLVPGQVVTVVTDGECMTLADATTAEQVSMVTADGKTTYVYNIIAEGNLALTMTRYFSIFSITVEQQVGYIQGPNWNFAAVADTLTSDLYMTYSDETVKIGGTASNLGTGMFEGLAMQGANKFYLRNKSGGLYSGNGGGRKVGVLNLPKGSIVTVVTDGECMTLADAATAEQTSMETADGKTTYVYTMLEEGNLALTMTRYFSIFSIDVQLLVKYVTAPNWDFASIADTLTSDLYMTYSDETVKIGGTASNLGTGYFEGLAMQGANKFYIRNKSGGLYSGNGGGRKVGVLNLAKGSVVTIATDGECMSLADAATAEQTSMETADGKTTYVYTMIDDGNLALTMTRYFSIFTINVLAVQPSIKVPTIEATGDESDVMTVTMACETKGAQIYFTLNGGNDSLYTEPIQVSETTTIVAWSTDGKATSKTVEKVVTAGYVNVPTATYTKVSGVDRTITLACAVADASIVYKTDSLADYAAYTEPFVISDTTTVWAVASKVSAVYDTLTFVSDTMEVVMAAGTELPVNAPSFTKQAVDSLWQDIYEENNMSDVLITADQSSVLCTPEVTINYEFYLLNEETGRISETANATGVVDPTEPVTVRLGKLVATASADGYLPATAHMWLKLPTELTEVWSIDFANLAVNLGYTNNPVISAEVENAAGVSLGTITLGSAEADSIVSENFLLQTGTSWLMRNVQSTGLYNFNSGNRGIAVRNLKKNQLIKITTSDAAAWTNNIKTPEIIEFDAAQSMGNDLVFRVIDDGTAVWNQTRYTYTLFIGVYDDPSLTKRPDYSVAYVDSTTHYIEITSATLGADIYYHTADWKYDSIQTISAIDTVLVNDTTGGVAPEWKYDTTWVSSVDTTLVWGEYELYTEPLAVTDTLLLGAYAWYQDVVSEERQDSVFGGFTVQIAKPVITYVETTDAGKVFQITVDNSDVVSTPETPIYYTLPGGEPTLYTEPFAVANDVYGWMTAVSERDGYISSEEAARYVDARESYNEVYEGVTEKTAIMPAAAADIEFADAPSLNVEQTVALQPTGNIYFHVNMHEGYNNLVLPFNMTNANLENGTVKITDAAGNSLTRGEDYMLYRLVNTKGMELANLLEAGEFDHTANIVGTHSYLIKVADELVGQDLIFVSAAAQTIAVGTANFDAPASGFKFVNNRNFKPATIDVPFYLVNEAGKAFVRKEAGSQVPAYTTALIADSTVTVAKIDLVNPLRADYYVKAGDVLSDGLQITSVPGITMTYGNNDGTWSVATQNCEYSGYAFEAYAKGSNNPKGNDNSKSYTPDNRIVPDYGTYVVFTPEYDGTVEAAVIVNADKAIYVTEDSTAIAATYYPGGVETPLAIGGTVAEKYYGFISFDVKAGSTYYLFCNGSKMSYYGFNYISEGADTGIDGIVNESIIETGVVYDMMGRKVETLVPGQVYIKDGKKFMLNK